MFVYPAWTPALLISRVRLGLLLTCLAITSGGNAGDANSNVEPQANGSPQVWTSPRYGYSLTFPAGWVQIPAETLEKFRQEKLPAQAQSVIYEVAFQRGRSGHWFDWPYVIVQVIPTKLPSVPTEAQFSAVVDMLGSGRVVRSTKVQDSLAAIPNSRDRATAQSIMESLSSVYTDKQLRRYWMFAKAEGREIPVTVLLAGQFLKNGYLIQLNGYMDSKKVPQAFSEIMATMATLHTVQ